VLDRCVVLRVRESGLLLPVPGKVLTNSSYDPSASLSCCRPLFWSGAITFETGMVIALMQAKKKYAISLDRVLYIVYLISDLFID
jgi:hypothetical protein